MEGGTWGESGPASSSALAFPFPLPLPLLPGPHPSLSCPLTPTSPFHPRRQDCSSFCWGQAYTLAHHVHTGGRPALPASRALGRSALEEAEGLQGPRWLCLGVEGG